MGQLIQNVNKAIFVVIVGLLVAIVTVCLVSIKPVFAQDVIFRPVANLTENGHGLFPHVSESGNNVYVLWGAGGGDSLFRASADNGISFREPIRLDLYGIDMLASGSDVYITGIRFSNIHFTSSNDNGRTFNDAIDLSNNAGSSISSKIAVSGSNIYVVWEDDGPGNWDILFSTSNDKGTNFAKMINLSNSSTISVKPQIAASGKNVYVTWAENTDRDQISDEIFFRASNDRGISFRDTINLSQDSTQSFDPLIAASGSDVYVLWADHHQNEIGFWERSLLFRASYDGGATFGDVINLTENLESASDAQIAAGGDNVYVAWNSVDELFFKASNDNGRTFSDAIKLSGKVGHQGLQWQPSIGVSGKNVHLLWTDEKDIFFRTSHDKGDTFDDILVLNNEDAASGAKGGIDLDVSGNMVYAVWHESPGEWEILLRVGSLTSVSPPEWYLGENLHKGLLVKYRISHLDYKNGQSFIVTLWFGSQDDKGDWITDVIVQEEDKMINGTLKLSSLNLTPLAADVSPELEPYRSPIRDSLFWLGDYAPKINSRDLTGNTPWSVIACIGCGVYPSPMGTETIQAVGKSWDTHIVGWHYGLDSKFWIKDNFPLPIKAKVYALTPQEPIPVQFEFELLETSISDAIPEFPVNLMIVSAIAFTGVLVAIRWKNNVFLR